jgi:hypothetical protein
MDSETLLRLERLETSVGDIRETLGEIRGQICTPKSIQTALKDPTTMLIALVVFMATTSGQSASQLIQALANP